MTDTMIDKLSKVDLATVVVIVILISIVASFLLPWMMKLRDLIIKKYKKNNDEIAFKEKIDNLSSSVEENMKRYAEAEIEANKVHEELSKSIKSLETKLENFQNVILEKFSSEQEKTNKRTRADLKDKISKIYRRYHDTNEIYDVELEALEDLIKEYEEAGGSNSFVHSVVEKEMYTWNVTSRKK